MSINVTVIRESFDIARSIASQVMDRYCENLAADFPGSRVLFAQGDLEAQKAALLGALATTVENLDKPEILTKFLLGLGERQVESAVEELHYVWGGKTLLKTFGQFFGSSWTPELNAQWAEVYGIIVETMKKGTRAAKMLKVARAARERPPVKPLSAELTVAHAEVPELTDSVKQALRLAVKTAVNNQIRAEVQRYFQEEMRDIARMRPEELIRKAN